MTTGRSPLNRLQVDTGIVEGRPATVIAIDSVDVLHLQRPTHHPDGSRYPWAPKTFIPVDPVLLLPPDSSALLPTVTPRQALIGVCECGESGCGSLVLQVRRDGDQVVWEPDPDPPRHSVDSTWIFQLRQYLDAVDAGHLSTARWETRPRLLARELRRQRDSLSGFPIVDANGRDIRRLLDVLASPRSELIDISVATISGVHWYSVPVRDDGADWQVFASVRDIASGRHDAR
jgi:hypothetical protein